MEIHGHFERQIAIGAAVDRVYDFALPPLVLHTIFEKDARALKQWLAVSPRNAVTVLDTHDGIGVIDVGADARDPAGRPGLLPPAPVSVRSSTSCRYLRSLCTKTPPRYTSVPGCGD